MTPSVVVTFIFVSMMAAKGFSSTPSGQGLRIFTVLFAFMALVLIFWLSISAYYRGTAHRNYRAAYENVRICTPIVVVDPEWNEYYQIFFDQGKVYNVKDIFPDFLDPSLQQEVLIKTYSDDSYGIVWGTYERYFIQEDTGEIVRIIDINKVDK